MDAEFSEINITPFTDVLLVLLVIFMILAALVVPPGFERRLPCNCAKPRPAAQARPVEIIVTRNGAISVNGVRTDERGLYHVLGGIGATQPHAKLHLIADTRAKYALIIRVLDAAKVANLSDLTFVTQ